MAKGSLTTVPTKTYYVSDFGIIEIPEGTDLETAKLLAEKAYINGRDFPDLGRGFSDYIGV